MSPQQLDHAWIAAHIPHQGGMCLLERVEAWDGDQIRCSALSHRRIDNPLRASGRLGALNAVEYAAQAMAVHGALLAGNSTPPTPGFLGSARSVECLVDRLDDIDGALSIHAERLSADARTLLYAFTVASAAGPLVRGRAAVVLVTASST